MGWQAIGPFLVDENASAGVKADIQAVVDKLPSSMRTAEGGYVVIDTGPRPDNAPSWAAGFNQAQNRFWIDKRKGSNTRRYVIAHEYWHEWSRSHGSIENSVKTLVVGPRGNTETQHWTNDPDEGMANGFANAIGFRTPWPNYDFRAYIPESSFSYLLAILNGNNTGSPPTEPPKEPPPPTGTGTNYTNNDPNEIAYARSFLTWWNDIFNIPKHGASDTWETVLSRYVADTGNQPAADYVKRVLEIVKIDPSQTLGLDGAQPVLTFLGLVVGTDRPGDIGVDLDIFGGLTDFLNSLVGPVSHAFIFLVIVIIGLVLLVVGVKSRPSKGANE